MPAKHKNSSQAQRPRLVPFTFVCTACGAVEHQRTPHLPEGWQTEKIGNDVYAYCPDDAIDLPSGSAIQ
jgi:hypothetical protein